MLRAQIKKKVGGRFYARIVWASNGREIVPATIAYNREEDLVNLLTAIIEDRSLEIVKADGETVLIEQPDDPDQLREQLEWAERKLREKGKR